MMSTTHAGMGATGAALLVPVAPEWAPLAAVAAIAGGVFPDLDVLFEHRKTLHYHEYYWVPAGLLAAAALVRPTTWTVAAAAFLAAAGLHSVVDIFGGGLGRRPWLADDDRGVYSHRDGRWIPPRRWIRYDGAPEDLLATVAFAVLPALAFDGVVDALVATGVLAATAYVLVRKRLPDVYERWVA